MKHQPIHYEPHPVRPERKAELIAQGFKIIDAKFGPFRVKVEPSPTPVEEVLKIEVTDDAGGRAWVPLEELDVKKDEVLPPMPPVALTKAKRLSGRARKLTLS